MGVHHIYLGSKLIHPTRGHGDGGVGLEVIVDETKSSLHSRRTGSSEYDYMHT